MAAKPKQCNNATAIHFPIPQLLFVSKNDHQTTSSCSPSSTSSSPSNVKLTRQKKIRHLPDKDFSLHIVKNPPPPSPDSLPKEEATTSHTLPVPELASLLRRDGYALSSRQFSDYRLPSPNSSSSRSVKKDHGGVDQRLPEQTSRNSMERQAKRSGRKVPQKLEPVRTTQNDYMFNFPHKSAPSSPYSSPRISTQRHSSAADMFLSNYATSQKSQGWSAPEMQSGRYSGYTPQISRDTSPFHENPHFHSPLAKSPQKSSRISTSPTSPSNHILSSDVPISPFASNRNHDLPLPLPPGVASTSQAGPSPQVVAKPEIFPIPNQWQKGKLIGRGTFGSVYVATNLQTGALCAMKEVELFPDDPKSAECIKQLEKEIKLLSQLKHPNIVQYYGSEIVGEKLHIFLEYVHPGSISKYVQDHCGAITESVVRNFTRHILSGLAYLHSTWTIHRDIKGANLLVDASGVVKLADFGMAKHLSGQAANLSLKGSPYWMAPELIHAVMQKDIKSDLAYAVDVWSLGCTIIEMLNGKPPWSEYEGAAAMFKVLRETPTIPENLSPEGKDFLHCCFRRNPAERPTAGRLLEHRFLRNSQHFDVQSCVLGLDAMNFQENCFPALEQDKVFSPRRLSNSNLYQLPLLSPTRTSTPQSTSVSFRHYTLSPVNMADNLILRLPG